MKTSFPNSYTANLRSFFTSRFIENGISAYYQTAANNAEFPYIEWELRHLSSLIDDSNNGKRFTMEINAYDKSSTLVLDNLLDFLEDDLNGLKYNSADYFVTVDVIPNRLDIPESREIVRKRIQFEVRYFI